MLGFAFFVHAPLLEVLINYLIVVFFFWRLHF